MENTVQAIECETRKGVVVSSSRYDDPGSRSFSCQVFHHVRRGPSGTQLLHHELHRSVDMREEHQVTSAEIIQTRLSIRSQSESVFWTFAPACKENRAILTVFRELIPLYQVQNCLCLPLLTSSISGISCILPEQVIAVDKMIARVDIAIMFDHHCRSACRGKDTNPCEAPLYQFARAVSKCWT